MQTDYIAVHDSHSKKDSQEFEIVPPKKISEYKKYKVVSDNQKKQKNFQALRNSVQLPQTSKAKDWSLVGD
jgi:hypothetical protein